MFNDVPDYLVKLPYKGHHVRQSHGMSGGQVPHAWRRDIAA
jgi:hypothetical protein